MKTVLVHNTQRWFHQILKEEEEEQDEEEEEEEH